MIPGNVVIKRAIRLAVALIIGLALVSSLPVAAQAQDPVDLELGGEGATSWNISNIKPGDSGTKTVTLHNAGYKNGFVTVWVSDIVNSEGANPESETGDSKEPGELGDWLLFGLSGSGLRTNLTLPTTIDNFPQSASDPDYIKLSPLNAGDSVNLDWQWELPSQADNDVQGDSLSFTINYLLEELPAVPSGGGGGGGGSSARYLQVDMLDNIIRLEIRTDDTVAKPYVVADADSKVILEIDRGTKVTCHADKVSEKLEVTLAQQPLLPPDGMAIIGPVYNVTTYVYGTACSPVKFDPPIRLILNYDPETLPENSSSVFIACYDDGQGFMQLEPPAGSTAEVAKVKTELNHLSTFVVMAKLTPSSPLPAPPEFEVSNLTISPSQAQPNQPIVIGLTVTNSGDITGKHELELKIDGIVRAVREINLGPKSSETISFELSELTVGEHQLEVTGLTGQFSILSPPSSPAKSTMPAKSTTNWSLLGSIMAIVIGLLVLSLVKPGIISTAARKLRVYLFR